MFFWVFGGGGMARTGMGAPCDSDGDDCYEGCHDVRFYYGYERTRVEKSSVE